MIWRETRRIQPSRWDGESGRFHLQAVNDLPKFNRRYATKNVSRDRWHRPASVPPPQRDG